MWVIKTRKHVKSSFALIFYKKKKKKKNEKRRKKKKRKKQRSCINCATKLKEASRKPTSECRRALMGFNFKPNPTEKTQLYSLLLGP
jgi:hypothetical protein